MKKTFLLILILSFLLPSCAYNNEKITTKISLEEEINYLPYTFSLETTSELSPLEPKENILLGAYFPYNINYGIKDYESTLSKSMNHYVYEYTLGTEFDTMFILDCISQNKTPFIKVIPKKYDKYNLEQIQSLSNILNGFNVSCYIDLLPSPSQSIYDYDKYKAYFEKSSEILRNEIDNVSIIFTPNSNELFISSEFYPHSSSYDFLGFSYIGNIQNNNERIYSDFFNKFNYVYKNKETTKPIFITTFALSYFSKINNTYYINENINHINNIINTIKENYKRVKGINFYDVNSIINNFDGEKNNIDNYRLTENKKIKDNFYNLINDSVFLEKYEYTDNIEKDKYIYDAILVDDNYYISTEIDSNIYFEQMKHNSNIISYTFNNKNYYRLDDLLYNKQKYNIKIDDYNKTIKLY